MTLTILALIAIAQTAGASSTATELPLPNDTLHEGQWLTGIGASYFSTSANFDRSGTKVSLPAGNSSVSSHIDLFGEWGATSTLTLLGALPLAITAATATTTTLPHVTTTARAVGLGDSFIGLRYEPWSEPARLSLEADAGLPLYSRLQPKDWAAFTGAGPVPLGNGAIELTAMARLKIPLGSELTAAVGLGATARNAGLSDLLPAEAFLEWTRPRAWFARAGARAQFTLSADSFASLSPANLPLDRQTTATGGSFIFNGVNPVSVSATAILGAYLDKHVFLNAGFDYAVAGQDIARGPVFSAVLGFDLGSEPDPALPSGRAKPYKARGSEGFEQYYTVGTVLRASQELRQILIDHGSTDLVKRDELLDVFEPDTQTGDFGDLASRGRVMEVGPTRAKIQIIETFKDEPIEEGFVVRRPLR